MSYYRIGSETTTKGKNDGLTIAIVGTLVTLLAIKARPREGYVKAWRNA